MKIYENSMKFNEHIWKYKEKGTKMLCGGFAETQWNCKGYPCRNQWKSLKIKWNSMKIYENTKKMQQKCNVAVSLKFNESARGYPCRNQWKSVKIHWNSMKIYENTKKIHQKNQSSGFAEIQWNCKGVPL